MAGGDVVPGAVIHAAPAKAQTDAVGRRPGAVPERPVVAEDIRSSELAALLRLQLSLDRIKLSRDRTK